MRSSWKGRFHFLRVDRGTKNLFPCSYILSADVGLKVTFYNGRRTVWLVVKPNMVGRTYSSFLVTKRTGPIHVQKGFKPVRRSNLVKK